MDPFKTFGLLAATCTVLASCSNGQVERMDIDKPAPKHETGNPQSNARQTMDTTEQVNTAKRALADKLGVALDDIVVETARAVHWRSGAAGCPKPGMSYTMAIVPGMLIVLEANGKSYRYHSTNGRAPAYCPADRAEAPALGMGEQVM